MNNLLRYRNIGIEIFKKNEKLCMFILKFIVGFFLYSTILTTNNANSSLSILTIGFTSVIYVLALAFSFAILPITLTYILIILNVGVSISAFPFVAGFVVFVLLCFFVFFARLAPKESIFILATVICFYLKIPYIIPIIAGIYISLTTSFQIVAGCFIWGLVGSTFNVINVLQSQSSTGTSSVNANATTDLVNKFILVNKTIVSYWLNNTDSLHYSIIFVIVVAITFFIVKLGIDYFRIIAVIAGSVINLIGVIIMGILGNSHINIGLEILFTIISCGICFIIVFFDVALSYKAKQKVMFQDEENFYFVKIIPKIK